MCLIRLEIEVLTNTIFYHAITRKIITSFGSLFSDIKIARRNAEGIVEQTIAVPIAYAPKEKWLVRVEQDPSFANSVYTTLPRLSFEINGISYDAQRKTNRLGYITCSNGDGVMNKTYAPVPYNIEISLYAITKTTEDGLQIIEQILPFFAPELTMSINAIPESNIVTDIPVILNSLSINDEYDGDFQTRRFITYTMTFTLKAWMFGPVSEQGIINRIFVNMSDIDNLDLDFAGLDMIGNTDGSVDSQWTED